MIPLILDLSKGRILVFGAGNVGVRKANHFAGKCRITIVSRSISPDALTLPGTSIKQLDTADIEDDDLRKMIEKHDFIIAALSDTAENERICRIAQETGKWYNSAADVGNFLIPSVIAGEEYTIAVSTSGSSPAVPKFIREQLTDEFKGLDNMIRLQKTLRETLKTTIDSQEKRAEILRAVLHDDTIWDACAAGKTCDDLIARYL